MSPSTARLVYVSFDSDVMLKRPVYDALPASVPSSLRGANVAYAYLPPATAPRSASTTGSPPATPAPPCSTSPHPGAPPPARRAGRARADVDTFDDVPDEPGHRVLDDVAKFLDRFVAWQPVQRDAVALWWPTPTLDAFGTTPRLTSARRRSSPARPGCSSSSNCSPAEPASPCR